MTTQSHKRGISTCAFCQRRFLTSFMILNATLQQLHAERICISCYTTLRMKGGKHFATAAASRLAVRA